MALEVVAGGDWFEQEDPSLVEFAATFRAMPGSEVPGESAHAVVHRAGQSARFHTEAYMSYISRQSLIEQACSTDDDFKVMARAAHLVSNPNKAVHVLGLQKHRRIERL